MSKQEFYLEDPNWAQSLQEEYEEYLWKCESLIDGDYGDNMGEEDFTTLSGEPFDGCQNCYTREQLFFLVPKIIAAYKEGKIVFTEDEK
jgi:hypothetical protein